MLCGSYYVLLVPLLLQLLHNLSLLAGIRDGDRINVCLPFCIDVPIERVVLVHDGFREDKEEMKE